MRRAVAVAHMTPTEYVAFERASGARHEFLAGEVYAMAGGSPEHGALAAALMGELRLALRGKPCRVFTSDVRVRIGATGLTTYPDLSVVCGALATDLEDSDAITNPSLLVEVLSDSTEGYDRGAKAAHYRRIPSLQEYGFVSPEERRIEVFRRTEGGGWELDEALGGQQVTLRALGVTLSVDEIYANPLDGT